MGMTSSREGQATATFFRSGFSEEPDYDNYSWPSVKPALHSTTIRVDPRDRAWVRRHVPAGRSTAYDLFDRHGNLVSAVTLDGDRALLGSAPARCTWWRSTSWTWRISRRYALPE